VCHMHPTDRKGPQGTSTVFCGGRLSAACASKLTHRRRLRLESATWERSLTMLITCSCSSHARVEFVPFHLHLYTQARQSRSQPSLHARCQSTGFACHGYAVLPAPNPPCALPKRGSSFILVPLCCLLPGRCAGGGDAGSWAGPRGHCRANRRGVCSNAAALGAGRDWGG